MSPRARRLPLVAAGALCGALAIVVLPAASTSAAPGAGAARGALSWAHPRPMASSEPSTGPAQWLGPDHEHLAAPTSSSLASNWAGIIDTGTTFNRIGANWTVPAVLPSQAFESSGTWVGLDGASPSDQTVIQTGTAQATAGGQTVYFAWYELFPAPSVLIGGVLPGDAMSALVSQASPGTWSISIQDLTSAQSFSADFAYAGPGASAEWIEEAPAGATGRLATLADFGTVTFTGMQVGGTNLGASQLQFVSMADPTGRILASPGSFNPFTDSFVVTYSGPGPLGSGYDLVGSDGGVFVFPLGQSAGFYGSIPGLGIAVHDIVGMVPSPDDRGYFLVGSDGGVFAFGDAPYLGSVPGLGVHIGNVVGIAATPSDAGYWVVAGDGTVYAFGDAPQLGSATGTPSPVSGIAATPDGGGYWIVTRNGSVYQYGDAGYFGSLPSLGVTPSSPVIGLVPTADQGGYWLIGSDGGIFAFGDAPFVGSLPGLGVRVGDVVGAVPTTV